MCLSVWESDYHASAQCSHCVFHLNTHGESGVRTNICPLKLVRVTDKEGKKKSSNATVWRMIKVATCFPHTHIHLVCFASLPHRVLSFCWNETCQCFQSEQLSYSVVSLYVGFYLYVRWNSMLSGLLFTISCCFIA